ncbi:MAG: HAD-IC family P-type ATPase, partial [Bdellovibrionales bacterium]|nr:HAD-IC family P-type ATPase [Bdellovibrionales bacterium]
MSENEMRFHIEGVRCQKCLAKIYNLRDELPGISSLQINMGIQQLTVKIDKKKLLYSEFAQAITNLGYELKPLQNSSEAEEMIKQKNRRSLIGLAVAATATGNIMLLSTANYAGAVDDFAIAFDWISFVLFLPILLYSAQPFWQSFFNFLKTFTVNIDLTIITAIILGTTFSAYNLVNDSGGVYFDSMAMLLLLLLSSRYLLDRIQQNYLNTNYLTPLLLETAVDVWIPCSNKYESRPVKNLVRGDLVLLQKDQSVPVDGKVTKEGAFFNTAVITGESKPQYIDVNQTVFAGSRLLSEQVELAVEKVGGATRMGTLLAQLSEQIQTHTQLTSQLNKVAQVFTVSIITLSFIIVSYFSIFDLSEGIQRALALVILACPCALALAVPLTQSLGLIKASKEGVIIKDANVLHNLLNIKNFVF